MFSRGMRFGDRAQQQQTVPNPKDHENGHYSVVGAQIIRPNSVYRVAVTTFDARVAIEFRVSIVSNEKIIKTETVILGGCESRMIPFDIGNIPDDVYQLVAEGLSGIVFKKQLHLNYDNKFCSVLVQTDKSVYKPGDIIRYRVLVLDRDLKPLPVDDGGMMVYIRDGKGNRIKQWSDASPGACGVFESELALSTEPVLGEWSINVEVLGLKHSKTFDVDEYVLPTFEVTVESPGFTFLDDELLKAVVNAKYTYGKPVVGELTVSVKHSMASCFGRNPHETSLCQKVLPIDGKTVVEFSLKDILKSSLYIRDLTLDVEVSETLTGRTQKGSTTVSLHENRYKFRFIEESSYFPGLPYNAWVQVSNQDGSPVRDGPSEVVISLRNYNTDMHKQTATLDDKGMAKLDVNLDAIEFDYLSLHVDYRGKNYYIQGITKPRGGDKEPLMRVCVVDKAPTPGEELTFDVASTAPIRFLAYSLLSRGELVEGGAVKGADSNTISLKLPSTYHMVPRAKLLVHFINEAGYIIAGNVEVTFQRVFENQIHLRPSKGEVKPGESIDIDIRTENGSFVGLMAVDQSVLLLKSGNDISRDQVVQELEVYESSQSNHYHWNPDETSECQAVGAVMLSNRFIPQDVFPEGQVFARAMPASGGFGAVAFGAAPVMKMSAMMAAPEPSKEPTVRANFPETWIWESRTSCKEAESVRKIVPDTITSWIITGFALSTNHGIGLLDAPSKVNVFLPFFLSIDLPYSVKLGETVRIPVVVFNYMDEDQDADVVFFNQDGEFEFVSDETGASVFEGTHRQVRSLVSRNAGKTLSFVIKPSKVGHITLKIRAKCPLAGDGIERQLLVEPEGLPQYVNKALLIDLRSVRDARQEFTVDVPKNAVPDSTKVEVSVIGDVLGSSIENLDSLIRMPFGCGEQNMLNFVPCIVVLDYLTACRRLSVEIEKKAKKCMEVGYQRELTYKHQDGSFSAFGEGDKSGSTWLTAFVAKSFQQATKHITIEVDVVDKALGWLSKVQTADGAFPEVGTICHKDMQGDAGSGIALTAYTVVAFLENGDLGKKYKATVDKALAYIQAHVGELDDVYAHALVAYALQMADHALQSDVLVSLKSRAKKEGDHLWWAKPVPGRTDGAAFCSWYQPCSVNVEMSAYGLLAILEASTGLEGLPIMKWLVSQRNDKGGFQSTQDTVVGLQALSKMAAQLASSEADISVKVAVPNDTERSLSVTRDNVLVLQKHELPDTTRSVSMEATGSGCALFQLSYKYNVKDDDGAPRFTLNPVATRGPQKSCIDVSVCTSFIPKEDQAVSNMAVMEVDMPSGFVVEGDTVKQLMKHELVKKVETKRGGTTVVLYFDNIGRNPVTLEMSAFQKHEVENAKPSNVIIYDYYDNTRCARSFYEVAAA